MRQRKKARTEKLTPNQQLFVQELLADKMFSPTRAAEKAGYKNAAQAGGKLMLKPEVQAAVGVALRERTERIKLSADRLLEELAYIALRDPIDMCDESGRIITDDLRKIPERMRRCIDGMKVRKIVNPETGEETTELELKLVGKQGALELAMKHFGMLQVNPSIGAINVNIDWEAAKRAVAQQADNVIDAQAAESWYTQPKPKQVSDESEEPEVETEEETQSDENVDPPDTGDGAVRLAEENS